MSGVFDKKADKINRREERTKKELQEKKKIRIITIIVVIVFALLVAGALFINSKFIRRSMTAVTIGGINFSAVEFDYFYSNAYSEYENYFTSMLGDYASAYLPSSDAPHSSQIQNSETGETWADYFNAYTIGQLSEMVQYYNAAMATGFTISDETRASIESELDYYRAYAEMYGYTFETFLQMYFGNYMNEKCLRNVLNFANTAIAYGEYKRNSFTYADGEIAEYYSENKDTLDNFTYRYFLVSAETVSRDDYATDEEYEAARQADLTEAGDIAAMIADGINSEEDFIAAAAAYNGDIYEDHDSTLMNYPGSSLTGDYAPSYASWLLDEGRQYGDYASYNTETGSYVLFFIERDSNEYLMTEMRQILIMRGEVNPDDFTLGEDDPEYLEALANADIEAKARAEEVVNMFIEGGATEEKLIELMPDYSDDTTEGGFYDLISKSTANNKMMPEIEEWLFDPQRQVGDYELIRTEAYGYHFVYFAGFGERYCDYLAKEGLRNNDFQAWQDALEPVDSVKHWAFMFTSH